MSEYIYKETTDSDGVVCYIKRGEIVRCKDCKWYMEYIPRKGKSAMMCFCPCCIGGQGKKKPTDYCSYGEFEEQEHE